MARAHALGTGVNFEDCNLSGRARPIVSMVPLAMWIFHAPFGFTPIHGSMMPPLYSRAPFIERRDLQGGGQESTPRKRLIVGSVSQPTHPGKCLDQRRSGARWAFTKYRPARWRGLPCLGKRGRRESDRQTYALGGRGYLSRGRSSNQRYPERHDRFPAARADGEQLSRMPE